MNKSIKFVLPLVVASVSLVGCNGSDDNSDNSGSESIVSGVYSAYAQDAVGDKVSLKVIVSDNAVAKALDFNDSQKVLGSSTHSADSIAFDGYDCTQASDSLVCNNYTLKPMSMDVLALDDLDGSYKKVDSTHNVWTMVINSGSVDITNEGDLCTLSGTITLELDNTVPALSLTPTSCAVATELNGYAELDSVVSTNDTLNLLVPGFSSISSNWTK